MYMGRDLISLSDFDLAGPLEVLPPVEFCCAYGSSLLSPTKGQGQMVDYILGVEDPIQWHLDNLQVNRNHYSSWMAYLGPRLISQVADVVGAGVHFNPFVEWRDKVIKYGVVRMEDLARDVLTWDKFYLSGRLQKPVHVLVDYWDIRKINLINLKAAISVALLLLPSEFTEEDLYTKICSLSYMGDLRMLFAEDKNKVRNIVQGSFMSLRTIYMCTLLEYKAEGLLRVSSCSGEHAFNQRYQQDCSLSATRSLFSCLPLSIHRQLGVTEAGGLSVLSSRQVAANCARKAIRRLVMASSARQAVSGFLAAGGINTARYLSRKISKAWRSRG